MNEKKDGSKTYNKKIEINLCAVLFLIFLVLKLTNVIVWSWWWVTSPLWIPFAIIGIIAIMSLFFIFLLSLAESILKK